VILKLLALYKKPAAKQPGSSPYFDIRPLIAAFVFVTSLLITSYGRKTRFRSTDRFDDVGLVARFPENGIPDAGH